MIPKLADLLSTMSSLFSVRLIAIQSICVHRFHSDSLSSSSTTWKGVSNRVHGRPEKNTKHVHEKANDKRIGAHESRPRIRWYDSMVVPGATGYYIIDRPSSSVPISCRDPWRSPGTTGLHVNLCTHGGKKRLQAGYLLRPSQPDLALFCSSTASRYDAHLQLTINVPFSLTPSIRNIVYRSICLVDRVPTVILECSRRYRVTQES